MKKIFSLISLLFVSVSAFSYDKIDAKSYLVDAAFTNARSLSVDSDMVYVLLNSKVSVYSSTLSYINSFPVNLESPASITIGDGKIYILDSGKSSVSVYDKSGKFLFNFGSEGSDNGQLLSPSDILYFNGRIFVANTKNKKINVYDKNGIFLYDFSVMLNDGITYLLPTRISIDPYGNLYVGESKRKVILKYDLNGNCISSYDRSDFPFAITQNGLIYTGSDEGKVKEYDLAFSHSMPFGTKGKNKYEFMEFTDIKPYDGGIFVLDAKNSKIIYLKVQNSSAPNISVNRSLWKEQISLNPTDSFNIKSNVFNILNDGIIYYLNDKQKGVFVHRKDKDELLLGYGEGSNKIKKINDIFIYGDKSYFADLDDTKIKVFENFKYLISFGDKVGFFGGGKDGKFSNPSKISIDINEKVYVLDTSLNMIQVFNNDGIFLYSIDLASLDMNGKFSDIFNDEAGNLYALSYSSKKVYVMDSNGKLSSSFDIKDSYRPQSFAYDGIKFIFILDTERSRVYVYDKTGNFYASFFAKGVTSREFMRPGNIRYSNGRLYISDESLGRISSFKISYIPEITNFKILGEDSRIKISWDVNIVIKSKEIFRSTDNINFTSIAKPEKNEYSEENLLGGTTYFYRLTATSLSGDVVSGDVVSFYVQPKEEEKTEVLESADQSINNANKPPLEIITADLKYIFSANYKYYLDNPIGSITVKNNTQDKFENIKVSFYLKEYMDFPSDIIVEDLLPNSTKEVTIKATLNNKIINITENTPVQSQISVKYYSAGVEKDVTLNVPVKILSKDSIVWDDTRRIANFITVKDPIVVEIAKNLNSKVDDIDVDVDPSIITFSFFSNYLASLGIKYVEDPVTPYKLSKSSSDVIIDTVLYPRNLIKIKSGDCDDLTVMFASLFEAVGIKTVIMDYPDHITLMFEIKNKDLSKIGVPEDMIINYDNSYYLPAEVTMISKPVYENISYASAFYKNNKNRVNFYDTRAALTVYEPPTLESQSSENIKITDELVKKVKDDVESLSKKNFDYYRRYYQNIIDNNPADISARLSLGILYASNMMSDEALKIFNQVLESDPKNPSALNNIGNIYYIKGDYQKAIDYYNRSYEMDPYDANILVNISRCYVKLGKSDEARLFFNKAVSINPELKKYSGDIIK